MQLPWMVEGLLKLLSLGAHKHTCCKCNSTWEHSNACALLPEELMNLAHTCPKCGTEQLYKEVLGKPTDTKHPANERINGWLISHLS